MKRILKLGAVALLSVAVAGMPATLLAQAAKKTTEKKPAVEKKETTEKKAKGHPFHGKLAAVDKVAKTITLGESTYQINSETKIKKLGKPATLEDGVVGEVVSGYAKPDEAGKMIATTVNFGPKPEAKGPEKKKEKPEKK